MIAMAEKEQSSPETRGERHTFLVYDAESGEVVHGHKELVLPYGDAPSGDELERRALDLATQATGRDASGLKVTAVPEEELEPGTILRVDPKSGRLQAERPRGQAGA
jgi:hypothetical protein